MDRDARALLSLIGQSYYDPAGVARILNALRLNRGILWSGFLAVVCISVIVLELSLMSVELPNREVLFPLSPFGQAAVLAVLLTLLIFAIYFTGQMLGGKGRFPGALLLVSWWQVMAVTTQLLVMALVLVVPGLAGLVVTLAYVYMLVSLLHFINVLHGFDNLFMALATVVIAFLGAAVGLAILLAIIGVGAMQQGSL